MKLALWYWQHTDLPHGPMLCLQLDPVKFLLAHAKLFPLFSNALVTSVNTLALVKFFSYSFLDAREHCATWKATKSPALLPDETVSQHYMSAPVSINAYRDRFVFLLRGVDHALIMAVLPLEWLVRHGDPAQGGG